MHLVYTVIIIFEIIISLYHAITPSFIVYGVFHDIFETLQFKLSEMDHYLQNTKQNVDAQIQTSLMVFQKNLSNVMFKTKNFNTLTSYFDSSDLNNLYFLSGSAIHYKSKFICESCRTLVVMRSMECNITLEMKYFTESMDKEDLTHPSLSVIELILNCKVIYREHRSFILHNSSKLLMDKIFSEIEINFPICTSTQYCNTKCLIIKYFFTIRGYSISSLSIARKRKKDIWHSQ